MVATSDTAKVNLLNELAFAYAFTYADSAANTAIEALELSKKSDYKTGELQSLNNLSLSLTIQGNFTAALKYSFEALALAEELNSNQYILDALANLMTCYRDQEDYKEALKYGYRALAKADDHGVAEYQKFLVLGFVSSVYEKDNQIDSALHYGLMAEKLNSYPWSGLYLTLGNIYSKQKQTLTAAMYYRQAIQVAENAKIYIDLVDVYNKLSIQNETGGGRDSALYFARKCMEVEGIQNYPEGELRGALQLAHLYELENNKDSTVKYLKYSAALRNKLLDRQKIREAQSYAFNEKLYQEQLSAQEKASRNRVKTYVLIALIIGALLIAFFLWRNNRHKQKTNKALEEKNSEIQTALFTLKTAQKQLIQSEKMASLGELTAGIAHEIQNPLNFVNNFSEVNKELLTEMKEELEKGNITDAKEIAGDVIANEEKINFHGKRADSIVKGMLQHSRSSSGVKEATDINALCDEYLRLAYHGLRAKDKSFNAKFETDFDKTLGKLNVISQDIGRVVLNLINNAFYAVNERKQKGETEYEPTVTVSTAKRNGKVEIKVTDNGSGIPQKILDKIFQPFFTTKPTGQGTGLGLSLSYDIIKAHGGELTVQSNESEGTEFAIVL